MPPSSERALTLIGSPTTASTSSEKERFSRASSAKLDHAVDLLALGRAGRQLALRLAQDPLGALEAEDVEVLAEEACTRRRC